MSRAHPREGTPIDILLVELPTLLRDIVRRRLEQLPGAHIGETSLTALELLAGDPTDTIALVWGGQIEEVRWAPQRNLLAPCPGFRVLRLDDLGRTGVLYEMRRTVRVLPELGLEALLEIATRDE